MQPAKWPGSKCSKVLDIENFCCTFPRTLTSENFHADNPAKEWCPPGHGDLYPALAGTGTLDQLLKDGVKYMFVSTTSRSAIRLTSRSSWSSSRMTSRICRTSSRSCLTDPEARRRPGCVFEILYSSCGCDLFGSKTFGSDAGTKPYTCTYMVW